MAGRAGDPMGLHVIRVLGLWLAGFMAGAYAWQLVLAMGADESLVLPAFGLLTGIAITVILARALIGARHHDGPAG